MEKPLSNLIKQILLIKELVNKMYLQPYIDFKFDFWFETNNHPRFGITKNITGLPYIDLFDVIGFNTDKIYIIDFFYSIKDVLMDKRIPKKLLKEIANNKFWENREKIASLMSKYPDVFEDHLRKSGIVDRLRSSVDYEWFEIENTIEDGDSLTRIIIGYAGEDRETIDRVLFGLTILKDIYEELYDVDLSQIIDVRERRDNYGRLMTFLNIASDIIGVMPETIDLYSLYLHPIYYYNEVIIELLVNEGGLRRRFVLSEVEQNKYEVSVIEDNKGRSTYTDTIYRSVEILKDLLIDKDIAKTK